MSKKQKFEIRELPAPTKALKQGGGSPLGGGEQTSSNPPQGAAVASKTTGQLTNKPKS